MQKFVDCAFCGNKMLEEYAKESYVLDCDRNYFCSKTCKEKWFAETFGKANGNTYGGSHEGDKSS